MGDNTLMTVLRKNPAVLQDGFEEICLFSEHTLHLRGIIATELFDRAIQSISRPFDYFISWDEKNIMQWMSNRETGATKSLQRIRITSVSRDVINAMIYIPRIKSFLVCSGDVTFKVYDRDFKLQESIRHQEGALVRMEQIEEEGGCILISGERGIAAWKLHKVLATQRHTLEKLFVIEGTSDVWITKFQYESSTRNIYAFVGQSIYIISMEYRKVMEIVDEIHKAPVTACFWYARSQFYVSSCGHGKVICWKASHYSIVDQQHGSAKDPSKGNASSGPKREIPLPILPGSAQAMEEAEKKKEKSNKLPPAVINVFFAHRGSVTGLVQHMVPGLAISSSMDGHVKLLNLETFTVLADVDTGTPITTFSLVPFEPQVSACLFGQEDGTIVMWKISSICGFFGACSAVLEGISVYDKTVDGDPYAPEAWNDGSGKEGITAASIRALKKGLDSDDDSDYDSYDSEDGEGRDNFASRTDLNALSRRMTMKKGDRKSRSHRSSRSGRRRGSVKSAYSARSSASRAHKKDRKGSKGKRSRRSGNSEYGDGDDSRPSSPRSRRSSIGRRGSDSDSESESGSSYAGTEYTEDDEPPEEETAVSGTMTERRLSQMMVPYEKYVVAHGPQDIRVFSEKGDLICRMEPALTVNGIAAHAVSLAQQLMFCLFRNGRLAVFCTRTIECPLIRDITVDLSEAGEATGMVLIDVLPTGAARPVNFDSLPYQDIRGKPLTMQLNECLVLATSKGKLFFIDLANKCDVALTFSAEDGPIDSMFYRPHRKEMFIFGRDSTGKYSHLKLWKIPDLVVLDEVTMLKAPICFAMSHTLGYFALGDRHGQVRLFNASADNRMATLAAQVGVDLTTFKPITEIVELGSAHNDRILSISFCDSLGIYASASADKTVRFWTLRKQEIREAVLRSPCASIAFDELTGDLLVSQNAYILKIKRSVWDEGGRLEQLQEEEREKAEQEALIMQELQIQDLDVLKRIVGVSVESTGADKSGNIDETAARTSKVAITAEDAPLSGSVPSSAVGSRPTSVVRSRASSTADVTKAVSTVQELLPQSSKAVITETRKSSAEPSIAALDFNKSTAAYNKLERIQVTPRIPAISSIRPPLPVAASSAQRSFKEVLKEVAPLKVKRLGVQADEERFPLLGIPSNALKEEDSEVFDELLSPNNIASNASRIRAATSQPMQLACMRKEYFALQGGYDTHTFKPQLKLGTKTVDQRHFAGDPAELAGKLSARGQVIKVPNHQDVSVGGSKVADTNAPVPGSGSGHGQASSAAALKDAQKKSGTAVSFKDDFISSVPATTTAAIVAGSSDIVPKAVGSKHIKIVAASELKPGAEIRDTDRKLHGKSAAATTTGASTKMTAAVDISMTGVSIPKPPSTASAASTGRKKPVVRKGSKTLDPTFSSIMT